MICLSTGKHDIVSEFPLCFCIGLPPLLLCRQGAIKGNGHCVDSGLAIRRTSLICVLIEGKPLFGYAWLTHSPIVGRPVTLAPSILHETP